MSIKDNPNRVVRTKDSVIAFIGHKLETDGDILIECLVDAQSNQVTWHSSSKARYGKDFVEANESVQPLIDFTNSLIQQQVEAGTAPMQDRPIFNESGLVPNIQSPWHRLGFASKQDWKDAGSPKE